MHANAQERRAESVETWKNREKEKRKLIFVGAGRLAGKLLDKRIAESVFLRSTS